MPSPSSALQRLRRLRNVFGVAAEREKRALMLQLRATRLTTHAQALALHEDLLFICAFPGTRPARLLARRLLAETAARLQRLPKLQRQEADDSGMAGSTTRHVFPYPLLRWLTRAVPSDVDIDWRTFDDPSRLDPLVGLLLREAEREGFESGEFGTRDWIQLARPGHARTDLEWLAAGGAATPGVARWLEAEWDRAEVPLEWKLRDARWCATHNALRMPSPACRSGMRRPPPDAIAEVARPLPSIERLPRPQARRLIDVARAALAARTREVNAMTYPNVDEVYWCDLGEGTALAVIGIAPDQRLTLETNTGFLLFANGIPIGYGGVTPLFRHRRFGGGDSHNKEDEKLSGLIAEVRRKSGEREVDGVQHQLDTHKDDDDIAARQNARDANGEQHCA